MYGVLSCYDKPDAPRMALNCADNSRKPFSRNFDYHLDRFKKQCCFSRGSMLQVFGGQVFSIFDGTWQPIWASRLTNSNIKYAAKI